MADKKHELELINGIGPAIRRALIAAGKETYVDIASATVDEISAILINGNIPVPLRTSEKIEEIIQEAQQLHAEQEGKTAQTAVAPTKNNPDSALNVEGPPQFFIHFQHSRNDIGEQRWRALILPGTGEDEPGTWKSTDGSYTVKFIHDPEQHNWRTLIEHASTEETTEITHWRPNQWWSWIATKEALAGESTTRAQKDAPQTAVSSPPTVAMEQAITITEFEIVQPDRTRETVAANVTFTVPESVENDQPSSQYQILIFVFDLEKNESYLAGVGAKPFDPARPVQNSRIPFPMPALGRFQPHAFVLLPATATNYHGYRQGNVYTIHPPE